MNMEAREPYLENRYQDNYLLFCKAVLFTALFSALFTVRNLSSLYDGEEEIHYAYYFTAYFFLMAASLFSRLLVSLLASSVEPKAIDDLIFVTFSFMFLNLVALSALDSYRGLDFTGYIFGCLGFAFIYRGEIIRFSMVLALGFVFYWSVLVLGLGGTFDLLGSLPVLAFTCFSLYVSQSREKARYAIFEVSQQLEESNRKLQEEVTRDPLTSVYNRTYLNGFLSRELLSDERKNIPLGLIVCDVDDFKRVNDQFGHHCGDKALVEISTLLAQSLRNTDVLVRYDGEEFVILLPGLDVERARLVAEQLCQRISLHDSAVVEYSFTASFGVAEYRKTDSADSFLQRGYQCLYQAQAAGKNQCCHESE